MKKIKFTEIKKPYEFVLKIKKIIQGFKNLIIYLPVIWKDRDFDYYYTLEILHFKLKKQWNYFEKNGYTDYGVEKLKIAINLLEKIQTEYYFEEAYNATITSQKEVKKYLQNNKTILKKLNLKITENTQKGDEYYYCMLIQEYKQKKCEELFFELFKRYYKTWWI